MHGNALLEPERALSFSRMMYRQGTKDTKASADTLSYDVLGAAISVHRELGPGLLESAYEACLCRELSLRRINYKRQVPLPLRYRGMAVDCGYRVDLIVGGLMLLEVKAVTTVLPIHRAQAMTYIKLLKLNLGFVINFNVERLNLGIYRIVMS